MKYAWWFIVGLILFLLCTQQTFAAEISGFDPTQQYVVHSMPLIVDDSIKAEFDNTPSSPVISPAEHTPEAGSEGKQEYSLAEAQANQQAQTDLSSLTYKNRQQKSGFFSNFENKVNGFVSRLAQAVVNGWNSLGDNLMNGSYKGLLSISAFLNRFFGGMTEVVNNYIGFIRTNAFFFALVGVGGPALAALLSSPLGRTFLTGVAQFTAAGVMSAVDVVLHAGSYSFGLLNAMRTGASVAQGYETSKGFVKKKTGRDIGEFKADLQVLATRVVVALTVIFIAGFLVEGVAAATAISAETAPELILRSNIALNKTSQDCNIPGQCDTPVALGITAGSNFLFGVAPSNKSLQMVDDEAKAVKNVIKNKVTSPLTQEEIEVVSKQIAEGHAFEKHVLNEVKPEAIITGVRNKQDFIELIEKTMKKPNDVKIGRDGRIAFWNDEKEVIVIYNPNGLDVSTAFRPPNGKEYFIKKFD